MRETGTYQFNEAILQLAARYGVTDELDRSVNKPDFHERPARIEEKDGSRYFDFNDEFTANELKVLGPLVTQTNTEELHWYSVKAVRYVKGRITKIKCSNEHYPIFARECLVKPAEGSEEEVKFSRYTNLLTAIRHGASAIGPKG